jgi:DNA-binding transcriptional LysR family regulator
MPSVKQLEAFIAVVESGSFQGAARRLNTTQPAISKRISELEATLGVRLFERTTRECHVTPRGRALVHYAQRIMRDLGDVKRSIGKRSSLAGHVRLGVVETIALVQLPKLLHSLAVDLPELKVDVEVSVSANLVRKVRQRELDVAVVVAPVVEQDVASEPFWDTKLTWIAAGADWKRKPLTIESLAEFPILVQTGSRHVPVVEGWFKSKGVRAKNIITCNSLSAAVKMTAAGVGLSLVPIDVARMELDAGTVTQVPVQMKLPLNPFVTSYLVGQVEPAVDALIEALRDQSKKLRG